MSEIDLDQLKPAIQPYLSSGRSGLMPTLHAAQKVYGWLSEPVAVGKLPNLCECRWWMSTA